MEEIAYVICYPLWYVFVRSIITSLLIVIVVYVLVGEFMRRK
jgi:uncharacterized membrane protein (DUF106 family)